jgi:hypothetical protein
MAQGVNSPSVSGNSTKYSIGGTQVYTDVLWNNHLIGDFSSQGLPDSDKSLVPTLHNFIYDVQFFTADISKVQSLEFDINQFVNGKSFIFGHECNIAEGNVWAVWDNQNSKWVPTGKPCFPKSNSWNHVVIQVQRTSDGQLLYQTITLNGETQTLNWYLPPSDKADWYGITINYQQDGNFAQQPYDVFIDNLNFTYW